MKTHILLSGNPPNMAHFWYKHWQRCREAALRLSWAFESWKVRKKLAAAEFELGELGWQQADFDVNDPNARELQSAEKEFARLVFDMAEIREELFDFQKLHAAKSAVVHGQIKTTERLVAKSEFRLIQLRKLLLSEKERGSAPYIIESEEKSIAMEEHDLERSSSFLKSLLADILEMERESRIEIDRLQNALKTPEARLQVLRNQKSDHFVKIGKELADVGIAPLNQPSALENVLALRCQLAVLRQNIRRSADSVK